MSLFPFAHYDDQSFRPHDGCPLTHSMTFDPLQGEVLYRVRWKNYTSDDDTWEPEAHLEDCREVLLAYKKSLAEIKAKKESSVVSDLWPD